jgi:hypothetical protein
LQDDGVAIAIGDQAGQAVGLAMDQPQALLALQLRRQATTVDGGPECGA